MQVDRDQNACDERSEPESRESTKLHLICSRCYPHSTNYQTPLLDANRGDGNSMSDNSEMISTMNSAPYISTTGTLSAVDVELLVIPWFEGEDPNAVPGLPGVNEATGGEIRRALVSKE